ncbi:putative glucan endo-1,3-beta-glucosidase [Beauveria bassiana]|nr:putative glucan endo-1,3-beta-glucosidase [Beauveria bassiana]
MFSDIKEASIEMATPQDKMDSGFTGLVLDNVKLAAPIKGYSSSKQILDSGYYREASVLGSKVSGLDVAPFYERARNQYKDKSASDFVHIKDEGAKGDGSTDDTQAVQSVFNKYKGGSKIIYIDAGTYILKDTVIIPSGVRIVGETWSQSAAYGDVFSNADKPKVMLRVGNEGDVGNIEMQDLILTSKGPTPGVVLMEWNIQAKSNGDAALWDVHIRLGGAVGTQLTPAECPPSKSGTNPDTCKVASLLLHITPKASGYFDNLWAWVADHQIDDPLLEDAENNMEQLSVYSARGILVESQKATFLYGTASEHSVFYQYNFHRASNIVTTFLQTESAYFQPTPKPPAPFTNNVRVFPGDPDYSCKAADDFNGCDSSWAVVMTESSNVLIGSAGVYSWFSTYTQECIDKHSCQKSLIYLSSNYDNVRLQQVISIGAKNMIVSSDGTKITSDENQAVTSHPQWAHISLYDVPSKEKPPTSPEEKKCDSTDYFYYEGEWPKYDISGLVGLSRRGAPLGNSSNATSYMPAYATIVNLTPHNFKHVGGPKPYQFHKWDFDDIPSGKGRRNDAWYKQAGVDLTTTNGYAYYEIEGTNQKFNVHVTTNMDDVRFPQRIWFDLQGMGMGAKEYTVPSSQRPVTLVIGGSKEYGFFTSLQFGKYNWMKDMYDVIKDRKLHHVVVPGSHDAAMNNITMAGWWGFGSADNTETQSLDLYNQLKVGSRFFDMRISSVNNGKFYGAHVSDELGKTPAGATGPSLDDLIIGMNRFSNDYPGEVVIWYIKYMTDLSIKGVTYWSEDKIKEFYDKLETIHNRCPGDLAGNTPLNELPISTFMNANDGKGCVLLLIDGRFDPKLNGQTFVRPDKGIFFGPPALARSDVWAQEAYAGRNGIWEVNFLTRNLNRDDRSGSQVDNYYIMQWQCTPVLDPIQPVAVYESNPTLYYYGLNYMTPKTFPTVILHDAVGLFRTDQITEKYYDPTMQVFVRGLNLYMVSQNCKVSKSKNPLVRPPNRSKKAVAGITSVSDHFDGIIFANGTTLDTVPNGFCFSQASCPRLN